MIEVTVDCDANRAMELVRELRAAGLVQSKDFDFVFHPSTWDGFSAERQRHVVFAFYTEKYGTFYALKWS